MKRIVLGMATVVALCVSSVNGSVEFDGTDDGICMPSAPASSAPLTLSCWIKLDQRTGTRTLMALTDTSGDNNYFALKMVNGYAVAEARSGSVTVGTATGTTLMSSTTSWYHLTAVFHGSAKREIYVDGTKEGTDTTGVLPSSLDRTCWGYMGSNTPGEYYDGEIAYSGIWTRALPAADITALSDGSNPHDVDNRGDDLVAMLCFYNEVSHEPVRYRQFDLADPPTDDSNCTDSALTEVGAPSYSTALPTAVGSYLISWPMEESADVPGAAANRGLVAYSLTGEHSEIPVIADEDGTPQSGGGVDRSAMYCYAEGKSGHSVFSISLLETGLEEETLYFAFDFAQDFDGRDYSVTIADQGDCTGPSSKDLRGQNYIGRWVKYATGRLKFGANNCPHKFRPGKFDIRHAYTDGTWYLSPTLSDAAASSPTPNESDYITDYQGADGTDRTRVMIKFEPTTGSDGKVTVYGEDTNGDYKVIMSETTIDGTSNDRRDILRQISLRARVLGPRKRAIWDVDTDVCSTYEDEMEDNDSANEWILNAEHECWFSNIALGVDIDDVWDAQDNTTGGANNPTLSP